MLSNQPVKTSMMRRWMISGFRIWGYQIRVTEKCIEVMEDQMEKQMEDEMETVLIEWFGPPFVETERYSLYSGVG